MDHQRQTTGFLLLSVWAPEIGTRFAQCRAGPATREPLGGGGFQRQGRAEADGTRAGLGQERDRRLDGGRRHHRGPDLPLDSQWRQGRAAREPNSRPHGVWWLVKEYAESIGLENLAPH